MWATLRDAWEPGRVVGTGSSTRVDVDVLLFPFDLLDVDFEFQIQDSQWLFKFSSFCCCGLAGKNRGILRGKQHPAAVQLPRVI